MVVDVIIVDDIGILFDCSVLEVIQCLLGVFIEWFVGFDDLDYFSVEGSGVIICGMIQI